MIGAFAMPTEGCGCNDPCNTHCTLADNVTYTGPNLPCTGIQTGDNLTLALQKLDEEICELFDLYNSLTTTTTTTTNIPCVMEGESFIYQDCSIIGTASSI
jgi:hypothetical protein